MNDIRKLRRLMSAANHLRKQNPVILRGTPITSSQALKYAWWFEAFRKKLATGVWRFSYFKKDGSIRQASISRVYPRNTIRSLCQVLRTSGRRITTPSPTTTSMPPDGALSASITSSALWRR